jgi:endogenous inhibitor of DNA gyrase (YacG/DUF329 family)
MTRDAGRKTKAVPPPLRECPICGRPATRETYPFCSRRCAERDLNRWLSGAYVIPAGREENAEGEDKD